MIAVEFIYDRDCPNVPAARANLLRAFRDAQIPARWTEWERSSPDTPAYAREFGSPAILVNGRDIAGLARNSAASCRIYGGAIGTQAGVPPVELIANALAHPRPVGGGGSSAGSFKRHLPLVPAVFFALLPKVACPACWPAYIGLLSAVGLGFLAEAEFLFPLTIAFLVLVLASLAYGARNRRGLGPLMLGSVASAAILFGKFAVEIDSVFYAGLTLLVGSSLWNTWSRKQSQTDSCCECAPAGTACQN